MSFSNEVVNKMKKLLQFKVKLNQCVRLWNVVNIHFYKNVKICLTLRYNLRFVLKFNLSTKNSWFISVIIFNYHNTLFRTLFVLLLKV